MEGSANPEFADEFRADLLPGPPERYKEELTPGESDGCRAPRKRNCRGRCPRCPLEQVGLAGREDLACKYLSQGQKRRVALARLVKEKRPLWVLDEPFVALDLAAVAWLAGLIGAHLQRAGWR